MTLDEQYAPLYRQFLNRDSDGIKKILEGFEAGLGSNLSFRPDTKTEALTNVLIESAGQGESHAFMTILPIFEAHVKVRSERLDGLNQALEEGLTKSKDSITKAFFLYLSTPNTINSPQKSQLSELLYASARKGRPDALQALISVYLQKDTSSPEDKIDTLRNALVLSAKGSHSEAFHVLLGFFLKHAHEKKLRGLCEALHYSAEYKFYPGVSKILTILDETSHLHQPSISSVRQALAESASKGYSGAVEALLSHVVEHEHDTTKKAAKLRTLLIESAKHVHLDAVGAILHYTHPKDTVMGDLTAALDKIFEHGHTHAAEHGHTHAAEHGHTHAAEGGHTHAAEGGHTHAAEGGHTHAAEGGHTHAAEGGHTHAAEGGHTHAVKALISHVVKQAYTLEEQAASGILLLIESAKRGYHGAIRAFLPYYSEYVCPFELFAVGFNMALDISAQKSRHQDVETLLAHVVRHEETHEDQTHELGHLLIESAEKGRSHALTEILRCFVDRALTQELRIAYLKEAATAAGEAHPHIKTQLDRKKVEVESPAFRPLSCFKRVDLTERTETDCPICLEVDQKEIIKLTCGHKFHRHCLDPWLAEEKPCPTCRQVPDLHPREAERLHCESHTSLDG